MKRINKTGFTLIELIVVMTIIVVISLMAFAPYAFYMNKAKVQYTNKELSQIIYEAKNMARNWSAESLSNVSVWVYFDPVNAKNSYELYTFPHDLDTNSLNMSDGTLLQKYILQPGIQLDKFHWDTDKKWVIFFQSISGSGKVYKGNSLQKVDPSENKIRINYSYKWSQNPALSNSLEYFQDTQIIDY